MSRALITSSVAGKLKTLLLKRHVHIGEHQQEGMLKFRVRGKGKQGECHVQMLVSRANVSVTCKC